MVERGAAHSRLIVLSGVTVGVVCAALFALPDRSNLIITIGLVALAAELVWAWRARRRAPPEQGRDDTHATRLVHFSLCALIVLSFMATVAFVRFELEPIESRSNALLNALPSVQHIAGARESLLRIESSLRKYRVHGEAARSATKVNIATARSELAVELDAYRKLPPFPGEPQLARNFEHTLAVLDERLDDLLDDTAPRPSLEARSDKAAESVEDTDQALFRLQSFNIDHAVTAANDIVSAKKHNEKTALGLFGLSLATSIFAVVLLMRLARTQERAAAQHLELLQSRAEELEAFAGRVAHDLKDPLGGLSLRLALLQKHNELDREQRDHLGKAVGQVERMNHTIAALLEFARAGANPPAKAHADLKGVLDQVVTELKPAARSARANLEIDDFEPLEVACTPAALASVLENLLGNAVKYVGEGRKVERAVHVRVDDREERVHVEIEDSGPGLSADSRQRAFLPFVRVRPNEPATGIGLATVKRLVEAYGGKVGVRSVLGQGSVFWFDMPKAAS